MRLVWIALVVCLLTPTAAHAAKKKKKGDDTPVASELYEKGLRFMRRGYYTKALEYFQRVRNYHRDDPASVKAQLAIADVHFKKQEFEQARYAYEEFASYHPRHDLIDYVTWRKGMSIYKRAPKAAGRDQSATRGAVNTWTGFEVRFAESAYTDEVLDHLDKGRTRLASKELWVARFYEDREAWGAVEGRCQALLRRYGDTKHAEEALYLLGVARHSWGNVSGAEEARGRLSAEHPESTFLARLDKELTKPPGEKPNEAVFVRPYRIRGMTPGMP
jgi:outer membrane protein assembly factor BamD